MKVINEKGKLFGIINVVDLIILLAVVLVAGAIIWQLIGNKVSDAVAPQADLNMVVVVTGCSPNLVEEVLRQDLVGERIVNGNEYLNATVTDVWITDYYKQIGDSEGVLHNALDPSLKNICFKIHSKVAANTPSPKIGAQEVRTGTTYIVKTQTFTCSGNIYYVQIGEEDPNVDELMYDETDNYWNDDPALPADADAA